jgi:hypothetical protein
MSIKFATGGYLSTYRLRIQQETYITCKSRDRNIADMVRLPDRCRPVRITALVDRLATRLQSKCIASHESTYLSINIRLDLFYRSITCLDRTEVNQWGSLVVLPANAWLNFLTQSTICD